MTNLPLPRNLDGSLALPGRVRKTLVEPFINTTAMPSWLTLSAGTAVYSTTSTTRGEVAITTGAVSGNQAKIALTTGINIPSVESVLWEIEGFNTDLPTQANTTGDFGIGLSGGGGGGYVTDVTTGNGTAQFNTAGAGNLVTTNYQWRNNGEASHRRNIGLLMLVRAKHLYLMEGDQVMAEADYSAVLNTTTTIIPDISLTTREAVAHVMKIAQIRLTITCN